MTARKAARVFPDPVGAAISTCCCAWIAGQACSCGAVAASNVLVNQLATAGGKDERAVTLELPRCGRSAGGDGGLNHRKALRGAPRLGRKGTGPRLGGS